MSDAETYNTSSGSHAPKEVRDLAERLAKQHGCKVTLSMEASGYHIYLPCPSCLSEHGRKELRDPKYAINASKYLGIGAHRKGPMSSFDAIMQTDTRSDIEKADKGSSVCMRTRSSREPHMHSVSELLNMTTISERHPDIMTSAQVVGRTSGEKEAHWEEDPLTGIKSPPLPGVCTPVVLLRKDHPCIEYIRDRGFDPISLYRQFGCEFCETEYPEGRQEIFYRRFPGGWKDTPAHRLIFYSISDGQRVTWQGRVIERVTPDGKIKQMLHPYKENTWSDVAIRPTRESAWINMAPFDEVDATGSLKFVVSKYRTAKYSNRAVMGWDAAMKAAATQEMRYCVLCEGPLDAARVGPGGIAVLGSSLTISDAQKIATNFHVVITAFDNDKAGKDATAKVTRQLMSDSIPHSILQRTEPLNIPEGKDIGEMKQEMFDSLLETTMRRLKRQL